MKAEIIKTSITKTLKFPLLAEYKPGRQDGKSLIVLFTAATEGVVLVAKKYDSWDVGQSHDEWTTVTNPLNWHILEPGEVLQLSNE